MYQFDMTDDEVREAKWPSREVAKHLDAAIVGAAAIGRDRSHSVLVVPVHLAGLRIERVDVIEGRGDIHHPVDHDRRSLQRLADIGLENPGNVQSLDVGAIDLLGRIEALLF